MQSTTAKLSTIFNENKSLNLYGGYKKGLLELKIPLGFIYFTLAYLK
jgi:hypothetical protein